MNQSGKTPISERISIFEQKQHTPPGTGTTPAPSPGRIQISITKKTVTTSRNFSAIKSQFNSSTPNEKNGGTSPLTPSPPNSLRGSAMSLNSTAISSPFFKESPTPTARATTTTIKQPLTTKRSGSPTNKPALKDRTPSTTSLSPIKAPLKGVSTPNNVTAVKMSPKKTTNNNYNNSNVQDTDKVNGNISPPSPPTSPPPFDNLNERNNKNSFTEIRRTSVSTVESSQIESSIESTNDLVDNARSSAKLSSNNNLNLKNNSPPSGNSGQVRSSYWTNQALQNDNAQKISEVIWSR